MLFLTLFLALGCQKFNWDGAATSQSNQVQLPVYSPAAGAYNAVQNVSIATATAGANICYTVDGSTPACDSSANCSAGTLYSTPVTVAASQTIIAVACKATMTNSPVFSGNYIYDTTVPTITAVTPASAANVITTNVSYTLSENCGTGKVTWTWVGGVADGASPHVQPLVGSELASGAHTNITLVNNPSVVANASYDISFDCTDPAGNVAATVTSTGVMIDNVAPVISATAPASGAFVPNTTVSYTLSEACSTASITWTRTGGSADGGSPHVQALAAGELTVGVHSNITLTANPVLVSGAIYTLDFNCTDAAGNAATMVSNTSVTFDNVAPVIAGVSPANNSIVNTTQVSYTLSETCATGTVNWTWISGNPDVNHNQSLVGGELSAGAHSNLTITNNPTLVSGALYNISFNCTDAAGNAAAAVNVTNITFDSTGPVISAVAPASSAGVNTTQVSYTLSETCASGSITWTWTSGAADGGSPHVQGLVAAELTAGPHNNITLSANPALVSGATYTLDFNCTDAAANAATTITVTNVLFDNVIPVISAVSPTSGAFVNNQQVSYTLSENCASGTINWTWTGGTVDAGHNQGLIPAELTAGAHNNFLISNNPVLVSGAVYTITFGCTDLAGNVATAVSSTSVTFDNTSPTVTLTNLRNNGPLNTGFAIGTAGDVGSSLIDIRVSLDGGAYTVALGTTAWKFALPSGAATWADRSTHTIDVRATDAAGNQTNTTQITVRKGNNHDINGDGIPDMATNAWQYSTATGRAYVFYGVGTTGIPSGSATAAPTILTGEATNNFFGRNCVIADFNGDGFGDLATGAYGNTTNTGKAYIFNGGAGGIASGPATGANRVITGGATNNNFGTLVIAGNANNDGFTDLVVGANAYNASQGRAYVYYGGAGGIAGVTAGAANVIITGEAGTMQFASAMALGDFNNDGNPDLAVGAPAYNTNWGRVYMLYGSAGVLNPVTAVPTDGIAVGEAASNFYGSSLSVGDINGDGVSDLAVGAYGFGTNSGKMYIYPGVAGPGIATGNAATPTTTFTGEATNNYFTTSITIADTHADGYADILVGAYGYTTSTGRSYLFSGQAAPLASGPAAAAGAIITGEITNSNFGRGSGLFDVNGDGLPDIVNGANFYNSNQGRAYIFHSPVSGGVAATSAVSTLTGEAGTTEFGISISR